MYQTSQRNCVAIKVHTGISESVCWVGTNRDWDLSLCMTERYLWAHSVMHHHNELNVTKQLATGSCVTERVKRLAGNEIERGIEISTIESRASNIPTDKGNYVCCHNGLTDKDLRRIRRSQYGHSGFAIGY